MRGKTPSSPSFLHVFAGRRLLWRLGLDDARQGLKARIKLRKEEEELEIILFPVVSFVKEKVSHTSLGQECTGAEVERADSMTIASMF